MSNPFREGNGRSQREFIRCAAAIAGYRLDWNNINPNQMVEASVEAFKGKHSKIKQIFNESLTQMSFDEQLQSAKNIASKKGLLGISCNKYFKNINTIIDDLQRNNYIAREETIRLIERLERIIGKPVKVNNLSSFQQNEGEIGLITNHILKSLKGNPIKINLPER